MASKGHEFIRLRAPIPKYERMYKESNNFLGWPHAHRDATGVGGGRSEPLDRARVILWDLARIRRTNLSYGIVRFSRMLSRAVLLSAMFSLRVVPSLSLPSRISPVPVQGYKIHPRLAE